MSNCCTHHNIALRAFAGFFFFATKSRKNWRLLQAIPRAKLLTERKPGGMHMHYSLAKETAFVQGSDSLRQETQSGHEGFDRIIHVLVFLAFKPITCVLFAIIIRCL